MDLFDYIKEKSELEREFESVYGIPYGEYALEADEKIILSDEYRKRFDGLTKYPEVDEKVCECARRSILDNSGTYKESMYLLDAETGDILASIEKDEDKIESGIAYTDDYIEALEYAHKNFISIIAIHNHPIGTPPSLDDISKMAENHYSIAIVAGANGQVYRYYNPKNTIFSKEICEQTHFDIAQNIEFGYDVDRAFIDAYELLDVGYDILGGELYEK